MPRDRRKLLAWLGTCLIVTLCLWPKTWLPAREASPRNAPHADKVIHFAMFAVFGLLWMRVGPVSRARVGLVLAAAVALAIGTELLQGLPLIARDPDPFDAIADVLGGAMGVALVTAAGNTLGVDPEESTEP